MSQFVNKEE